MKTRKLYCPACGDHDTHPVHVDWLTVSSQDPGNVFMLQEWECRTCATSFWQGTSEDSFFKELLKRAEPVLGLLIDWWKARRRERRVI